jgi:ABC-2 type transport system ATP-binding protein
MADATPAVDVRRLSVRFGDFTAVRDVSFSVARGEIFGFLGANGAGKTTTIRVLCGLIEPTEGSVTVAGEDFRDGGLPLKRKVGYMSQKFTLYDDLTVEENLRFSSELHAMRPERFRERRRELLEFIEFDRPTSTLVSDLPGGLKQQVSLAASLLHEPEVVFLDEPTAGVTPAARARFWALIRKVASSGKTVFVTTHYMDEAEHCGRVALMRSGELIALDTPAGLKRSAFPRGLLELDPLSPDRASVERASRSGLFSLFEPYGLRYHAEARDPAAWAAGRAAIEREFRVREIAPSLEDVFIRLVEGGAR